MAPTPLQWLSPNVVTLKMVPNVDMDGGEQVVCDTEVRSPLWVLQRVGLVVGFTSTSPFTVPYEL
jgi:hypothetical protein